MAQRQVHASEGQKLDNIFSRLDSMENKIDKISEALVTMARTEERVATLLINDQEKTKWIVRLQDKMHDIEKDISEEKIADAARNAVGKRAEKLFWLFTTSTCSLVVGVLVFWATTQMN